MVDNISPMIGLDNNASSIDFVYCTTASINCYTMVVIFFFGSEENSGGVAVVVVIVVVALLRDEVNEVMNESAECSISWMNDVDCFVEAAALSGKEFIFWRRSSVSVVSSMLILVEELHPSVPLVPRIIHCLCIVPFFSSWLLIYISMNWNKIYNIVIR